MNSETVLERFQTEYPASLLPKPDAKMQILFIASFKYVTRTTELFGTKES